MGVKLKLDNPDLSQEEKTYLTAAYSSGTTLTVKNNEGFNHANFFTIVGEPGQERTEKGQISSITGVSTITIASALGFPHEQNSAVYLSQWDKISVERAATSGGSYTEITNSPFTIEWDDRDLSTTINDLSGAESDYYKWRFYNSVTGTYSTYSDILPGSGISKSTAGYALELVRKNSRTKDVDEETIWTYFTEFQDVVYEKMPEAWWFRKRGTAVTLTADDYDYSISSNWPDFISMGYLLFRYNLGDVDETYPIDFIPLVEFYNYKQDANNATNDWAKKWTLLPPDDDSPLGYIGIEPTPKTTSVGSIIPVYQFELDTINSFGDSLVVPSARAYSHYALWKIADEIWKDTEQATKYETRLNQDMEGLHVRKRRQQGQSRFLRFRGQKGYSRMFSGTGSRQAVDRENFW